MHVLAAVEQYHGHPAILADRHARGGCQLVVANELLERVPAEWGSLACRALAQRVEHVGWDLAVDLRQETRNLVAQPGDIELANPRHVATGVRRLAMRATAAPSAGRP